MNDDNEMEPTKTSRLTDEQPPEDESGWQIAETIVGTSNALGRYAQALKAKQREEENLTKSLVRKSQYEKFRDFTFSVWTDNGDAVWADVATEHLAKQGLLPDEDTLEGARAKIRLMSLASIYLDFCAHAFDTSQEDALRDWVIDLNLDRFRVGQFASAAAYEDEEGFRDALRDLIAATRSEVLESLLKGFGCESQLFHSLWLSVTLHKKLEREHEESQDMLDEENEDHEYQVFNPTQSEFRAFFEKELASGRFFPEGGVEAHMAWEIVAEGFPPNNVNR